jgi:hypothetical protein
MLYKNIYSFFFLNKLLLKILKIWK